jgi:Heavy metal associated domain 2
MHSFQILHDTPGRLRLALPAIANSRSRALACEDALRSLPGIRHVQASERTSNLLVLYAPSAATREAIQQRCASCAAQWPAPSSRPAHPHGLGAGTLSIMMELLPHLLPLAFGACPGCRLR